VNLEGNWGYFGENQYYYNLETRKLHPAPKPAMM
jgi:hypothetical protein